MRKNTATACRSGHYLLGNGLCLVCVWEMLYVRDYKAEPTFLCAFFFQERILAVYSGLYSRFIS